MSQINPSGRPKVIREFGNSGRIFVHGKEALFTLSPTLIKVGCTDITPQAAQYITAEWHRLFGDKTQEVVLQLGAVIEQPERGVS